MVLFLHCQNSWVQELTGGNGNGTTIIPRDPLAKFFLPVPAILCSAGLEVLIPEGRILPPGDTKMIPLNWKLRLPYGHFGFLIFLNQWARKGVTVLAGVTDTDH